MLMLEGDRLYFVQSVSRTGWQTRASVWSLCVGISYLESVRIPLEPMCH